MVTQSDFPLSYEIFAGNTFEGKTMLAVVEKFIAEHPQVKPIVADAAMLDQERLTELQLKPLLFIFRRIN